MQRGHEGRRRQIATFLAGPTVASNTRVIVQGRPGAMGHQSPHPGQADAAAWPTTGYNVVDPWTSTPTARRLPEPYANHTPTEDRLLTDHTRSRPRHRGPTKTSTLTPAGARQSQWQTSQPYGNYTTTETTPRPQTDHTQTGKH